MDILVVSAAGVLLVLYVMRRRARIRNEDL